MIAHTLEDLQVYRKSLVACTAVSAVLDQQRVRTDYTLRAQLSAASAAVAANIAEGFGQQSDRQFARYLFVARGSCHEVRAHLAVAVGRRHIDDDEAAALADKYHEIARMLTGLIKYLRASDRKERG